MVVLGMVAAMLAAGAGCSKPVDQGIIKNREAKAAFEEAANSAAMGELDKALSELETAEGSLAIAKRVTRSSFTLNQSNMLQQQVDMLKAEILAAKAERDAKKAEDAAKKAGTAEDAAPGDRPWSVGDAGTADAGAGGTPARTRTSLKDEEEAAKRARMGGRGEGADVDGADVSGFITPRAGDTPKPSTSGSTAAPAADADPIVITKIDKKGSAVVVHAVFNNKGAPAVIGSVIAVLKDDGGRDVASCFVGYLEKGFKPNWNDIFQSDGATLAAGDATVPGPGSLAFVMVNTVNDAGRVKYATVTVTLQNEQTFSGKGPK